MNLSQELERSCRNADFMRLPMIVEEKGKWVESEVRLVR